jgi:hypothetical protein
LKKEFFAAFLALIRPVTENAHEVQPDVGAFAAPDFRTAAVRAMAGRLGHLFY